MTLGCVEFRRRVGAVPDCDDAGVLAHARDCRSCAAFAKAQQALDHRLRAALALPVPEDLPARVVWRQAISRRPPRRFALAAGVVLAAALGLVLAQFLPPGLAPAGPLGEDVIAHIEHEPDLLLPTANRAEAVRVNAVLERGGANLHGPLPDVVHAGLCPFRGRLVPHLVVSVNGEPVSVLLLRNETVQQAEAIHAEGYDGVIMPHGDGSIAIVGARPELITSARERLAGVEWTAI